MAPTAAAAVAASELDLSPAHPSTIQLLLRNIDSRTIIVMAKLQETLDSVLERLDMPIALWGNLRVEYAGKYLRHEATIGELGLPQDATLQVTVRHLPKPYHVAWGLASKVADAARLLAATGQQLDSTASLDFLVWNFLKVTRAAGERKSASPLGPVADYINIFLCSGAPSALGQLYLSTDKVCRVEAERAIRWFLAPDSLTKERIVKVWTAPVLLELSRSIASGGARQADPLYTYIRRALEEVITHPEWSSTCWLDMSPGRVAEHLTQFVVEKADDVMGRIDVADLMLTGDERDLTEFKTFSWALRQQVRRMDVGTSLGLWSMLLYKVFVSLLRGVDEYMDMVDTIMRLRMHATLSSEPLGWMSALPWVRVVLSELDAWSGVVEWQEIRSTLAAHPLGTKVLVVSTGPEWCQFQNIRWITRHRDLLDFETRRYLAMTLLPKLDAATGSDTPLEILVDRSRLLADSSGYIAHATSEKLRAGLVVEFRHEEATGPGVRREWFCLVFQALFNQHGILFSACPSDRRRFFVKPSSVVNQLHLPYYEVVGRMIALALMHEITVGVSLDRTLYLQLAGRPVTLNDIANADPSLHASCKEILEMDPSLVDSDALGLTFVREVDLSGSRKVVELVPGGKNTAVTSMNRHAYVHLLVKYCFVNCTTNQVAYLARGFSSVLGESEQSKNFFSILCVEDFNQMLGGSKDNIDMKEWEAHTDYNGYRRKSRQVKWFWKAVKAMTVEEQRRLLVFWTSVEYLPLDGFCGLESRLSIVRSPSSCDHLPTSSTCFYQLNLPAYTSSRMMQSRLRMIVQEHVSNSFGIS